jgi:hypothetical protein
MAKKLGLADCFKRYGASGRNPRWSWSARSEDGKVVVLTLWKDGISVSNGVTTYDSFDPSGRAPWIDTPGNRERLENLKWARENCDGQFRVVVTVAKDVAAVPRAIADCYPQPNLIMRITELNEKTGEFRAVSV